MSTPPATLRNRPLFVTCTPDSMIQNTNARRREGGRGSGEGEGGGGGGMGRTLARPATAATAAAAPVDVRRRVVGSAASAAAVRPARPKGGGEVGGKSGVAAASFEDVNGCRLHCWLSRQTHTAGGGIKGKATASTAHCGYQHVQPCCR